ncbi:MAG: PspC domain-containing protein [Gammaproteobacteria bacterium]
MNDGVYRSSDDRVLGGVCGGLAHKWGMSSTALRVIVFVVSFFLLAWTLPIIVYIVCWIAFPERPTRGAG